MDFQIYFCTDGILRAKLNDNKPMIPVKFLHDNGNCKGNDFRFWARWWESKVHFEAGLTVGKFLACLEPWAEFWTDLTNKNVVEYIKESRRPIAVKEEKDEDKPMDWISLSYNTFASPNSEYDKADDESIFDDLNAWLNKPKNTRLTGEWEIYSCYKLSGFVCGEEEQYCIDYTPMNKLANLPIILSNKQILDFSNWKLAQILGKDKEHFFKENAFGLCSIKEGFTQFIIGDKDHNIRDIVEGFFWWFPANPTRRDEFVSEILDRKLEIDEAIEADLNEEEPQTNNVINLFGKNADFSEPKSTEEKPKKLKMKVESGAFSPMIKALERDKTYWEQMLDLASKENNVVLKIGKVEEAKSPEKRVFNYIVKDDNDPANPKPSDYKMW